MEFFLALIALVVAAGLVSQARRQLRRALRRAFRPGQSRPRSWPVRAEDRTEPLPGMVTTGQPADAPTQSHPIPPPAEDSLRQAEVLRGRCWVIDGDTIIIGKVHVRLAGIDAPELDQPYGRRAKQALYDLCDGQVITAVTDGTVSHDRAVAHCTLPDGRDLSAEMVKAGLALDWPKFSGGRYAALEPPEARKRLWRVVARQQGRMPPPERA